MKAPLANGSATAADGTLGGGDMVGVGPRWVMIDMVPVDWGCNTDIVPVDWGCSTEGG